MSLGDKSDTIRQPRLLEVARNVIRTKHLSYSTEKTYLEWMKRYIRFHNRKHPKEMGAEEISQFLSDLAVNGRVAASTQNQALNALVFLYRDVLNRDPGTLSNLARAKRPKYLPAVFSQSEVRQILDQLDGPAHLMAGLLYGAGLRLRECLRLRIKDVDFESNQLFIRDAKGQKDRSALLPSSLQVALKQQIARVERLHTAELSRGFGRVSLPFALERKYPNAATSIGWQYVFPSISRCIDPYTGRTVRHHVHE